MLDAPPMRRPERPAANRGVARFHNEDRETERHDEQHRAGTRHDRGRGCRRHHAGADAGPARGRYRRPRARAGAAPVAAGSRGQSPNHRDPARGWDHRRGTAWRRCPQGAHQRGALRDNADRLLLRHAAIRAPGRRRACRHAVAAGQHPPAGARGTAARARRRASRSSTCAVAMCGCRPSRGTRASPPRCARPRVPPQLRSRLPGGGRRRGQRGSRAVGDRDVGHGGGGDRGLHHVQGRPDRVRAHPPGRAALDLRTGAQGDAAGLLAGSSVDLCRSRCPRA